MAHIYVYANGLISRVAQLYNVCIYITNDQTDVLRVARQMDPHGTQYTTHHCEATHPEQRQRRRHHIFAVALLSFWCCLYAPKTRSCSVLALSARVYISFMNKKCGIWVVAIMHAKSCAKARILCNISWAPPLSYRWREGLDRKRGCLSYFSKTNQIRFIVRYLDNHASKFRFKYFVGGNISHNQQ